MSAERVLNRVARDTEEELAEYIGKDLNVPSPFIGAIGPPDRPGPEQDYVEAINRLALTDRAAVGKIGWSLWLLLSQENGELAQARRVARPFLLFNLCELLQTVKVSPTEELFRVLRRFKRPLIEALEPTWREPLCASAHGQRREPGSSRRPSVLARNASLRGSHRGQCGNRRSAGIGCGECL